MPTTSVTDLSSLLRTRLGKGAVDGSATWVILDLHGAYPTHHPHDFTALLQRSESFQALSARLEQLARADSISGVLVRVVDLSAGPATCKTIGRALGRLQGSKRVVVYLPQVNMRSLLVAAGVTEVVAPESADVLLPGFAAERVYYAEFLTRRGIRFENLRIREYKSALNRFTDDHMDDHEREQLTAYLASAERAWLAAVAPDADPDAVLGPQFTNAQQLLDAGLISRIGWDDEIAMPVDRDWPRSLELVRDQVAVRRLARKQPGIAVVPVVGAIVSGPSRPAPGAITGPIVGSDTVVAQIRRAERDEMVKAIVLHVDSGGGSAHASDVIARAVERCPKPVVAVMGEVAASGGYYVLAPADHVVASPFTLTGSIGVLVGKPVLRELNERIGRKPETIGRELALFTSMNRPFSDAERDWAVRLMDEVYARFVARVAAGRKLSPERVDELGRGRIWSGADAHERGLVDELGDIHTAFAAARRLAGLPDGAPVRSMSAGLSIPGLPTFGRGSAASVLLNTFWPFGEEHALTWFDAAVTVR